VWDGIDDRLEGRSVVLEPLTLEHVAGLRAAGADQRIWRYMPAAPFETWVALAAEEQAAGVRVPFTVFLEGEIVGSTSYLNLAPEHRRLEIGWTWNNPSTWGRGVNTEAKYLLLRHAFEVLGCLRVEFKTNARNDRARAALAALPAEYEGIFRKHMVVAGERRDSAWYAVIDDDWPQVKANLERRIGGS
jgi:RimJ/RimL family protein N-acetyltransferase